MAAIKTPHKKSMKVKREEPKEESSKPKTAGARKKQAKEKLSKTAKVVLVLIGVAAMLLSVTAMACSGILNQVNKKQPYTLTGGVAATVNGVNITEDTVTKQIMSTRASGKYTDDKAWAQYLVKQGKTPETYREDVIQGLARQYLLSQAIKDEQVSVSNEEVQKAVDSAIEQYGGKDNFLRIISAIGYTETTYKDFLHQNLLRQALRDKVAPIKDVSDQQVLDNFNENFATYNDARRSENLLIKVDAKASDEDKAKAKEKIQGILDKINAGEMSFEDAVKEYSEDKGSQKNKGDVGWDKLTRFVAEYQSALSQLGKDGVSGVVETSYGYHLIKCTDVFKLDDKAEKIDQLPKEFKEYLTNVIKTRTQQTAYAEWMDAYVKKADIKINDMPAEVPYNVSLEGVGAETGSQAVAQTTGTASTTTDKGSAE
ncbi:peptidylprolyl isomerase [Collinsella sp. zg1085]|uniref:peptidylprolyl isomerase n=1 Tax=Collinsella sp. zg1085 TaxID=2844380 RepID=UPI001C0D32B8|nr:peptidylprolyl isomerase [Collinsella sp. zg1085]QWT17634.1 peptidylprolyl isomerase [Collinsella sp. zg1085]